MRLALAPWLALVCATAACAKKSEPLSPGNAVLEITELLPHDNAVWLAPRQPDPTMAGDEGYPGDPGPVTLGCDAPLPNLPPSTDCTPRRLLAVQTDVQNFYLRAPDACSGETQCGLLIVDVDPGPNGPAASARAASTSVVLDLSALDASGTLVGEHVLRPHLVFADLTPFTAPYAFTPQDVTVTFAADTCSPLPETVCSTGAGGAPNEAGGAPDETGGTPSEAGGGGAANR